MNGDTRPIAIMDSGVGGLSILREVVALLPNEDILYFADQGHVPYGPRPIEQIRDFSRGITEFFLARRAKTIVLACNAASAASLHYLRKAFPEVPFVGMEPAVKPAAEQTRSGVIGVITTKATFQGELFASVVGRFARDKQVVTEVCPDFVELVEAGDVDSQHAREVVQARLAPLLEQGIDQLVLGCTHFPFLTPLLAETSGPGVTIVDPSPAIARQTGRVIAGLRSSNSRQGSILFFTSGSRKRFIEQAVQLLAWDVNPQQVAQVVWTGAQLVE